MEKNKILAGIILVGILVLAIAFMVINQPTKTIEPITTTTTTLPGGFQLVVENGDMVEVNYIGSLDNGTVFDTSYKDVAIANNIYDPARRYPPLKFNAGSGQVIQGFDDVVIGMKIGQEKTVKIPPKLAYGMWDPKLVEYVNRTQRSPRIQNVTLDRFLSVVGKQPVPGMEFTVPETPWPITVMEISNITSRMNISLAKFKTDVGKDPVIGKSFTIPGTALSLTVLNFNNNTVEIDLTSTIVAIRHNPAGNEIVDTIFGKAAADVTDSEIIITADPVVGSNYGGIRVIALNETTITVDMNYELAGKTLIFDIKVENITKGSVS